MPYHGVWDDAGPRDDRRLGRTLGVLAVVVAVLAWVTLLGVVAVARPGLPDNRAMRFVPADGTGVDAGIVGTGGNFTLEHSRVRGAGVLSSVSPGMADELAAPEDPSGTYWWRAVLLGSAGTVPWLRLFRLTSAGVELDAATVSDRVAGAADEVQAVGAVFRPGVVVLPAAAEPGAWSGNGDAVVPGLGTAVRYEYAARLAAAPQAGDAAAGCVQVVLDLVLTAGQPAAQPTLGTEPLRWSEEFTFCPERGLTADQTRVGKGILQVVTGDRPSAPEWNGAATQVPAPRDLNAGAARLLPLVDGDPVFGLRDSAPAAEELPGVSGNQALVWVDRVTGDLRGAGWLPDRRLWSGWYARPGTTPTAVTTYGTVVLAATADRTLTAYAAGAGRLWQARLPEVAVGSAVAARPGEVVVGSLDGTVTALSLRDGRQVWQVRVDNGIAAPVAATAETVVVADGEGGITILDAGTGDQLGQSDGYHGRGDGIAVHGGVVVVWAGSWIDAYDTSGTRLWGVGANEVSGLSFATSGDGTGTVVATGPRGTVGHDPTTGRVLWRHDVGGTIAALTGGVAVTDGQQVVALDAAGAEVRRWTVPAGLVSADPAARSSLALRPTAEALWLVSRATDGTIGAATFGEAA